MGHLRTLLYLLLIAALALAYRMLFVLARRRAISPALVDHQRR